MYGEKPIWVGGHVPVANAMWKVVVLLKRGQTLADVTPETRVISIVVPNSDEEVPADAHFADFLTTPREIEKKTGLSFFNSLPKKMADALRDSICKI